MRIAAHKAAGQFHPVKQACDTIMQFTTVGGAEIAHGFGHLIKQLHLRVQAGERILKHHLHIGARLAQRLVIQRHHIHPIQRDLALHRLDQPQDRAPGGRFATARFPHQRQGAPLVQRERHILDRVHIGHGPAEKTGLYGKARGQPLDPQQRRFAANDRLWRGTFGPQQAHRLGVGFARHLAQFRHGGQQGAGVIVLGVFKNVGNRPLFYLIAAKHHHHAIGHLRHHRHIMGDEHHSRACFTL